MPSPIQQPQPRNQGAGTPAGPPWKARLTAWGLPALIIVGVLLFPLLPIFLIVCFKSKRARLIYSAALIAAYVGICFLLYSIGFIGSGRARIEHDHALVLPASAADIRCSGPVSLITFGDYPALATFEMNRDDLDAFLAQFKFKSSFIEDALWTRHPFAPASFGTLEMAHTGMSRNDNVVRLQVYGLSKSRVGVLIDTIPN